MSEAAPVKGSVAPVRALAGFKKPPRAIFLKDAKIFSEEAVERPFLIFAFISLYVIYAALGRDVFYNHLYMTDRAADPIGAILPYLRVLVAGIAFLIILIGAGIKWTFTRIPLIFLPFCIWCVLSSFWADDFKTTLQTSLVLIALWMTLPVIAHRLGAVETVKASLHLIAVVAIASFLLAVFIPSVGIHTGTELVQAGHAGRWRGIFAHKNSLGPWVALGSVFLFTHSWLCGGPKLYWWFARFCAVTCLVFSGAATAQVMTIIMFGLWFGLMMLRRWSFPTVVGVMSIAVVITLAFYFAAGDLILGLLDRDPTWSGRTEIWSYAIEAIRNKPWIGYGYLSGGGQAFTDRTLIVFSQKLPVESSYLALVVDLGIIGAILYFVPALAALRNGFEWLRHTDGRDRAALEFFILTLFGMMFFGITDPSVFIATGFDGVISFGALFALMALPRSPVGIGRTEFRLAKYLDAKSQKKAL